MLQDELFLFNPHLNGGHIYMNGEYLYKSGSTSPQIAEKDTPGTAAQSIINFVGKPSPEETDHAGGRMWALEGAQVVGPELT